MRGRTPESSPVQAPWRRTASLLGLVRSLGLLLSAPQMTFSSSFAILAVHPVQAPPSAIDSGRTSPFLLYWGRRDGNGGPLLDQHLQATMKRPQLMGERASEKIIVQPQRRQWRLKYSPKGWPSPPGSHRASKRVDTWGTMPLVHGAWSSPRALPASLGGLTKPVHMPLSQDHSKGPWEQGTLPEADPGPSVSPIFVFFFFFFHVLTTGSHPSICCLPDGGKLSLHLLEHRRPCSGERPPKILSMMCLLLVKWSESHSVMSDSLCPHGLYSPWNSPGQNTGVGRCSLLQRIFPTQGSNPGLQQCRQTLPQLSPQGALLPVQKGWDPGSLQSALFSVPTNSPRRAIRELS